MKEYSKGIYVKFKPEEVEILHDRMKEAGVQNMSAFIRKMVLNGYMIIPEWPELKGVLSLHSRISNNLNQYAKKANETGNIYREDIAELKEIDEDSERQAKELLVLTDHSVGEIAQKVGFGDASNFSTRFAKATGQSPLQYRKRALKPQEGTR